MKTKIVLVVAGFACALGAAAPYVYEHLVEVKKINNSVVRYVPARKVKVFPVPVVHFEREGLATSAQVSEIKTKIVYPVINHSEKPIAAIVVEFYTGNSKEFGVDVLWHDGTHVGQLVERKAGKVPFNLYRTILERPEAN